MQADGGRHPAWPEDGLRATDNDEFDAGPFLAPDGQGGAYFTWNRFADSLTAVLVSLLGAEAEPWLVRFTWYAADGAALAAEVERRTEATEWQRLGVISADGTGRLLCEDHAVTAGAGLAYRLPIARAQISSPAPRSGGVPAPRRPANASRSPVRPLRK